MVESVRVGSGYLVESPVRSRGGLEQAAPVRVRFRLAAELAYEPLDRFRLAYGEPGHHDFPSLTNFSGSLSKAALHPLEQK